MRATETHLRPQAWLIHYGGLVLLALGVVLSIYGAISSQGGLVFLGVLVAIFGVLLPRLERTLMANLEKREAESRISRLDLQRELVHQAEARFESADRAKIERWAEDEIQHVLPDEVELVVQRANGGSGNGARADLASPVRAGLAAALLRHAGEGEVSSAGSTENAQR